MGEFNRKKRYKKYIYSPFTLFLLILVLGVMMKALWGVYNKEKMSSTFLERENAELNRMIERKRELEQSVEYLKTDRGVEAEIRSKFRVVKEGESVAVIIGEDEQSAAATVSAATSSETFWRKFLNLFGF